MESAYFCNVFFASPVSVVSPVDSLTACETLPTDVLIVIGQFIDVKTMEEQFRFNKLTEKLEQFKTRTSQEWIDVAVQYPAHYDMLNVKVCKKLVKFLGKNTYGKENHYKKPYFVNYCSLMSKEKYNSLYINLINHNLSRFTRKYQGQKHVMLDGKNAVATPLRFWWNQGKQGCSPLFWNWFIPN
jgi:hypothetical protein